MDDRENVTEDVAFYTNRVGISRFAFPCGCVLVALVSITLFLSPMIKTFWPWDYRVSEATNVMAFSPDEKQFAYVWCNGVRNKSSGWKMTLAETLEVRWHPTEHPESERALPLDSADFRADKGSLLRLEARLTFSPDSKWLAAVSPQAVLLIEVTTGQRRRLHYPKEWFTALEWISDQEIAFSTMEQGEYFQHRMGDKSYWRLNITSPDEARKRIHQEETTFPRMAGGRPIQLDNEDWSPDGRWVIFFSKGGQTLLNIATGKRRTLPFTTNYIYWRPDSSAFLMEQNAEAKRLMLVVAQTGQVDDLTKSVQNALGDIDIHGWTAEGQFIIGYHHEPWIEGKPKPEAPERGFLIQPKPFKVFLRKDAPLRQTPLPGWVLVQGGDTMEWLNYAGTRTAPMEEWRSDWKWSSKGTFAAEIDHRERANGKVRVFKPHLPQ
jgi:hypothetical protein